MLLSSSSVKIGPTIPTARGRFLREAQITARLEHPGIVPIYGLGRDEAGNPCYAMRFVEGTTLAEATKQYHARAGSTAKRASLLATDREFRSLLQRFKAACTTVGYAHDRGVLHRDIKPANIMLGPFDATLVLDWGLGKIIATDATGATGDDEQEASLTIARLRRHPDARSHRHSRIHEPGAARRAMGKSRAGQ